MVLEILKWEPPPIFVLQFLFHYFCSTGSFLHLNPIYCITWQMLPLQSPNIKWTKSVKHPLLYPFNFCSAIFVLLFLFCYFCSAIFVLLFLFCWGLFALKPHLPHYLIDVTPSKSKHQMNKVCETSPFIPIWVLICMVLDVVNISRVSFTKFSIFW